MSLLTYRPQYLPHTQVDAFRSPPTRRTQSRFNDFNVIEENILHMERDGNHRSDAKIHNDLILF